MNMKENLDHKQVAFVDQAASLAALLRAEFGTPFALFDVATGNVVYDTDPDTDALLDLKLETSSVLALASDGRPRVTPLFSNRYRLSLPVRTAAGGGLLAVAEMEALAGNPEVFPARAAREQAMLQGWLQAVG